MKDKIRRYVAKYGEVDKWSLALQYQVLFETIKEMGGKATVCSSLMEHIYHVLCKLSSVPNSGVTEECTDLRDKQWEDTLYCVYSCGKYIFIYEQNNEYSLRSGVSSDHYLTVKLRENND